MQEPSVLLFGATLDQARELAVSAATAKDWRLLSSTPAGAAFEQTLEDAEVEQGSAPLRVIRIFVRFEWESAGVRVLLRAEEIEMPGSEREWMTDVTARYGDNLTNALSSLRANWDAAASRGAANAGYLRGQDIVPESVQPQYPSAFPRVGTWAYYAESYAQSRGCALTDTGAELEAAGQDWEQHLVGCRDGRHMRVHCRYGECTGAPEEDPD
jgi:hypothetical protein